MAWDKKREEGTRIGMAADAPPPGHLGCGAAARGDAGPLHALWAGGRPRDCGDGARQPPSAPPALGRPRDSAGPPPAHGMGGEAARWRQQRSPAPLGHLGLGAAARRRWPSPRPWDGVGSRATAASAIAGSPRPSRPWGPSDELGGRDCGGGDRWPRSWPWSGVAGPLHALRPSGPGAAARDVAGPPRAHFRAGGGNFPALLPEELRRGV